MIIKVARFLPKVSIMIPTYNQESFISDAVESSLYQDYPNLEVIVSDDCSTDSTSQRIKRYLTDPRVKYYRNKNNLGRVGNYRKTLYERATGEWVLNLDGDDFLDDADAISYMIRKILEHKDNKVVAVLGKKKLLFADTNSYTVDPDEVDEGIFSGRDIFIDWYNRQFGHVSTLYKSSFAKKLDFYRSNIISSDSESILRLILEGEVIVVDKVIGVWRLHGNNESTTKDVEGYLRNVIFIEEAYRHALNKGIDKVELNRWKRRMLIRYLGWVISILGYKGDKKGVSTVFKVILKRYPCVLTSPNIIFRLIIALNRCASGLVVRLYQALRHERVRT